MGEKDSRDTIPEVLGPDCHTNHVSRDNDEHEGGADCSEIFLQNACTGAAPSAAGDNSAPRSYPKTTEAAIEQEAPPLPTEATAEDSTSEVKNETGAPTLNPSKLLSESTGYEKASSRPNSSSLNTAWSGSRLSLHLDMPPPLPYSEEIFQRRLSGEEGDNVEPHFRIESNRQFQIPEPYPDNDSHCMNPGPGAYFVEGSDYEMQTEGTTEDREHEERTGDRAEPLTAALAPSSMVSSRREIDYSNLMVVNLSEAAKERLRAMARDAPLVEGVVVERRGNRTGGHHFKRIFYWVYRQRLVTLAILILIFAIITATVAFFTMKAPEKDKSDAEALEDAEDYESGSMSVQFQKLLYVISAVSANDTLSNQASPQFKALTWMANKDLTTMVENEDAIIQRYVMALLYYSTDGDNWAGNDLSHNAEMLCASINYVCWGSFEGIQMERSGRKSYLSPTWHECDWEGVGCYEGTNIVGAISLVDNNLMGTIPSEVGALKLQNLYLRDNQINGTLPDTIRGIGSHLREIDIEYNLLTGTVPDVFDALPNLTHFRSSINLLSGTLPHTVSGHGNLQRFHVSFNRLTGSLPWDFSTLPSLEYLDLNGNELTGTIPSTIGNLTNVLYLGLFLNELSGTIPESFNELKRLKVAHIGNNYNINGTIPLGLFDLPDLMAFTSSYNKLTGSIPGNIANAANLSWLSIDNNLLSGTIPQFTSSMHDLKYFTINSNFLGGTIPLALGDQKKITHLGLGNNDFVGTFPRNFETVTSLEILDISKNNITGSLEFLCDMQIPYIAADCGGGNAEVQCNCCQICCIDSQDVAGCGLEIFGKAAGLIYCTSGEGRGSIVCGVG